ncbi:MAG TPA: TauD/TfdA family dioxygenase [Xanthobacteraceae bacterium]|nr:TauD/TfdA family dioxygenase [Xanthobacteraceae bacterium]
MSMISTIDAGANERTQSVPQFEPLSKYIGSEVKGIDLREPIAPEAATAIYRTFLDRAVLLFRDQDLTQEDLIRVTGIFGEFAELGRPKHTLPSGFSKILPNIMLISNIRENGETIGALPDGEMMFHHDTIHRDEPHKATLLYSVEIPTHGGDTLFASGTAAYDTLDAATKQRLEGLKAVNYYVYNSVKRNDKQAVDASSQAVHPVVRTHEETGRKALYVNRLMSVRIEGMEEAESDTLLNSLFDHSEKPEFVYAHVWRKGDLIVWENRCSMHARTDFPADQRRLLLRTTVKGTCRPY